MLFLISSLIAWEVVTLAFWYPLFSKRTSWKSDKIFSNKLSLLFFFNVLTRPDKILSGLVNTLKKNKRLNLFENILSDFQDVLFEKRGYQKAKVTTSHAINDEIKNSIQELLHNQYGSKINLEFQVNNSLLGGMTVVIGSKMIDLSILNQVSKFTNNVKGDI